MTATAQKPRYPELLTCCAVCGTRARCFCEQPDGDYPRFLDRRLPRAVEPSRELEELV